MVLAELRELAGRLGLTDTAGMRKSDLISAIKERQGAAPDRRTVVSDQLPLEDTVAPAKEQSALAESASGSAGSAQPPIESAPAEPAVADPSRAESPGAEPAVADPSRAESPGAEPAGAEPASSAPVSTEPAGAGSQGAEPANALQQDRDQQDRDPDSGDRSRNRRRRSTRGSEPNRGELNRTEPNRTEPNRTEPNRTEADQPQGEQRGGQNGQNQGASRDDDDENGRRRGRRFRDRNRRGRSERPERREGGELEVREDDVLLPVAGILDVLDNYAFVRTSGYLSGPNDVYVSLSLVRKYGLRRGDAITGAVRQPRDGEAQRQKFNPLVRVDTINGLEADEAKHRPEFTKLTPLYPNERLRLETEQHLMTTRVIDLVMPIGKGQRALIVSPPKAGKTMILQAIANAITTNNPECHLMVVLVDERPEEVTDMQRSVKGEVIASTFDRPPSDHTSISELAIERAKRLVEMGHDVVVLLDSITRLGRAYNLAAPASGRILSGGVDSTALYPPKRFLGAARNIEDGGSLTIFATALVETGSTMDTVIFEEFKGTGNAELKLDRKIADKRTFPAIDVNPSGTRKEELLLSPDELAIHHKLRRVLSALESQQAIDLLLDRLRKTRTNIEFLMQVSKSASGGDD
ncbi:MAG TPA: transcription termination factor Rho [Pseudonocardiaceae bacterium]|jgi:transcription termination factor Rho|nr:transcription termination factor Rho [Pseudonocardiaceae bacterium]